MSLGYILDVVATGVIGFTAVGVGIVSRVYYEISETNNSDRTRPTRGLEDETGPYQSSHPLPWAVEPTDENPSRTT
jgi:hypothetical protein